MASTIGDMNYVKDYEVKLPEVGSGLDTLIFDFESASLSNDPAILSIGAFGFNRNDYQGTVNNVKSIIEDGYDKESLYHFYVNMDLTEQFFLGLDIDKKTGRWHYEKNSTNLQTMLNGRISPYSGYNKFIKFLTSMTKNNPELAILVRRTHADLIWMWNLEKALSVTRPFFKHNDVLDIASVIFAKTGNVKGMHDVEPGLKDKLKSHHALNDCFLDAIRVCDIYKS